MRFSERQGFKPVKDQLQIENVDEELRNSLWSLYLEYIFKKIENHRYNANLTKYARDTWFNYFKHPIDTLPMYSDGTMQDSFLDYLREYFFSNQRKWYEYYDFIEFSVEYASSSFVEVLNKILEKEKSAYRLVKKQFVQITSKIEISEIENAILNSNNYESVNVHLNTALKMLADKVAPNYRNSIKESISAVESVCKIFTNHQKTTLGEALSKLEKENNLHPALKKSFSALYGYTSDDGGIRHALIEGDRIIDFHEAKFMLVTCSAFVNYLISRNL